MRALTRYGAVTGAAGGDARIQVGGKGRKNVLAITASYAKSAFTAPGAGFLGRLVVVEAQIDPLGNAKFTPPPVDFGIGFNFEDFGPILFDTWIVTTGEHPFFLPIAQQEGSPQSDESTTVNVILCIAQDVASPSHADGFIQTVPPDVQGGGAGLYIPRLVVSGQTVFGGVLAGQQAFANIQ